MSTQQFLRGVGNVNELELGLAGRQHLWIAGGSLAQRYNPARPRGLGGGGTAVSGAVQTTLRFRPRIRPLVPCLPGLDIRVSFVERSIDHAVPVTGRPARRGRDDRVKRPQAVIPIDRAVRPHGRKNDARIVARTPDLLLRNVPQSAAWKVLEKPKIVLGADGIKRAEPDGKVPAIISAHRPRDRPLSFEADADGGVKSCSAGGNPVCRADRID